MTRWLTSAVALAVIAAPAVAQLSAQKPGYVVIRVKLSDGDGGSTPGTGGGGTDGGPSYGGGGFIPPGGGGPGGGFGSGGGPPGGVFPGGGGPRPPGVPGGGPGGVFPGGGGGGTTPTPSLTERSVHVLVPFDRIFKTPLYPKKVVSEDKNPEYVAIKHPFGTSLLYANKANIQLDFPQGPTEEYRLKQEYSKWFQNPNRKPAVLLGYIEDALKAELVERAEFFSDELKKQFENDKELSPNVAAYIKGYTALKAKFAEGLPTNPTADAWKVKLGSDAGVYADSPHYAVVHFTGGGGGLGGGATDVVTHTVDLLEKNFKSFYLWHLKEGIALPLPDKKMVVVLTKDGRQLAKFREGLDGLEIGSDSFYAPVHNLTVICPERTDELGRTFNAVAGTKLEGFIREDLLAAKNPPLKEGQKPEDIALASTYTLVRKALEDEALRSAISREGSRQLFVSVGVAPQHVRLPRWLESGLGSVLQHAKGGGVVEVTEGGKLTPGIVVGMSNGHGAANYEQLYLFNTYFPAKKDGKENTSLKPAEVLTNVLTDRYFDAVAGGTDPDRKADPMPGTPGGGKPGGGIVPPGGGGVPPMPPGGGGIPPFPPGGGGGGVRPPGGGGGVPPLPPGGGGGHPGGGGFVPPMPPTPPGGGGPGGGGKDPSPEIQGPRPGGGPGGPPGGGFPGGPLIPGGGGPVPGGGGPGGGLEGPGPGTGGPGIPGGPGGGIIDPSVSNPQLTSAQIDQKAKASAWALTYYLTKSGRLPKLHAYLAKLNELPRDMRVDRTVSLKLFCESFGMLKPNSQEVDKEALEAFAKDWMAFIHQHKLTYEMVTLKKLAGPDTGNQPGTGGPRPPGPGGPGGGGAP